MTISSSGNWTGDDILLASAETYSLLPRPSGTATSAFLTLLREYWPAASGGTRAKVAQCLRCSARTATRVLDALDECETRTEAALLDREIAEADAAMAPVAELRAAPVKRTRVTNVAITPIAKPTLVTRPVEETSVVEASAAQPASVEAGGADHARDAIRHLATTGERGPEIQPDVIARQLRDAREPTRELAALLRLPEGGAAMVMADARGVLVALRALGVETQVARGLIARWHAAVPPGFEAVYEALSVSDCLDVVAAWRGAALAASSREPLRATG